jgi:hypothetical protein
VLTARQFQDHVDNVRIELRAAIGEVLCARVCTTSGRSAES